MSGEPGTARERPFFLVALGLLAVAAAFVVIRAVNGVDILAPGELLVPVLLALAVAAGGLIGWWRDRRRAADLIAGQQAATALAETEAARAEAELVLARRQAAAAEEARAAEQRRAGDAEEARADLESTLGAERGRLESERDRLEAERQRLESERDQLEQVLEAQRATLEAERAAREQLEQARRTEIEWLKRLRREVYEKEALKGILGDPKDVPALVLRMAMTLLEATKGVLLSREDLDGDANLDLAASEGFEHDPEDSALAQRFAAEVIEADRIIQVDDADEVTTGRRTAADEEIENLVAIPIYLLDKFNGVVVCANREGGFAGVEHQVLLALGSQAAAVLQNAKLRGQLRTSYLATVRVLADAMEAKDGALRGHGNEVARYASAVADRLGLEPRRREDVVFGSLLHDVGKIGISELLLLKPGPLSLEEYNIVKLHPRIGYRLVQQVPALDAIALGILHHHERFDGRGYPAGLKSQEIPQEARIICVADAFSAMTSDRPYRGRLSVAEACSELERFAGAQFDPEIVGLFVDEVKRQPPEEEMNALANALADPELEARRTGGDAILGQSPFALTDSLTLLYSHRYFHEQLNAQAHRAAVQGSPFALALFELQELPQINVREGYAAGDAAIQRAARALHRSAARSGATACRFSGKRLGLVIPHVDESDAHALAAELVSELPDLSVRVGVAAWRRGDAARDVLERALADLAAARTALPA